MLPLSRVVGPSAVLDQVLAGPQVLGMALILITVTALSVYTRPEPAISPEDID